LLVLCKESQCQSEFAVAVEVNLCQSGAGISVVLSKKTPVVFFEVRNLHNLASRISTAADFNRMKDLACSILISRLGYREQKTVESC
jgi:hypothetical protein